MLLFQNYKVSMAWYQNWLQYKLFIFISGRQNCRYFSMKLLCSRLKLTFSTNLSSKQSIELENEFGCHNYHPLPVVIQSAQGIYVQDCEGKRYIDFLSAYSSVNQGHVHPQILNTFLNQAQKVTLTSRAVHNNLLGRAEKYLHDVFGYDKTLFMNTGVQAGQSAIKLARRWGYEKKKVEENQAAIVFAKGNFWGRTIAACASSDDPSRYRNFGPFGGLNFSLVDYASATALQEAFTVNKNIVGFMVEPIQGEKGVVIPAPGYMKKVKQLCQKYNVLLIADQIQTGLGRTGKMLCSQHQNVRPDIVLLGKALSGGFMPVSAVLCDNYIMDNIRPGEHGSTFGGNPLACALAMKSIEVLLQEKMIENSAKMGEYLFNLLKQNLVHSKIRQIRGKGLFIGLEFEQGNDAQKFSKILLKNGLIAKPTQGNILRFSPPLIITKAQIDQAYVIIDKSWQALKAEL